MWLNGAEYIETIEKRRIFSDDRRTGTARAKQLNRKGGLCVGPPMDMAIIEEAGKHQRYLEVGTFDGVMLSVGAERYPGTEFHAVDSFENTPTTGGGNLRFFLDNCVRFPNVFLWVGRSRDMLPRLGFQYGFIFIDGEHAYENVSFDLTYCYENLLVKGGKMAIHDLTLPGVGKAFQEFQLKFNVELRREVNKIGQYVVKN